MTDHPANLEGAILRSIARIPGIPSTILVAPDSFKGTLSATEVAGAIGAGLEAGGHPVDLCPVADGGEGTLDALIQALDGETYAVTVSDPLGRSVRASFGLCADGRGGRGGRA